MSSRTPSDAWNAVERARRGANRSSAHSSSSCGVQSSNSTASSPASTSSSRSMLTSLLSGCGFAADEDAQLLVVQPPREVGEGLAAAAPGEPAVDEPDHGAVELRRRDAPEDRPSDLGRRAEAAADVDVERLLRPAELVADRGALEAEVADPVVGAGVRA